MTPSGDPTAEGRVGFDGRCEVRRINPVDRLGFGSETKLFIICNIVQNQRYVKLFGIDFALGFAALMPAEAFGVERALSRSCGPIVLGTCSHAKVWQPGVMFQWILQ